MVRIKEKEYKIHEALFLEAKRFIPGGVNSPVRSFKSVGGQPVFMKRGKGSKLYAENNDEFIDYCLSWGALILGHAHPAVIRELHHAIKNSTGFGTVTKLETELARTIVEAVPCIEMVRLTNSGTEAVMGAIRIARAYTQRKKIIKFEGSYHGHADYLLVKSGSGMASFGLPDSQGVPDDFTRHTIVLPFNNITAVQRIAEKYQDELAAIIVEPVQANCGVIVPKSDFLPGLRQIADTIHCTLIFDEVITGFRLSYGGAQAFFDVQPDITCLGKIIGGGLPVGAFGGKREIMQLLAPDGNVYQAGTLSGNPIAVTAGLTTLKILKESSPYDILARITNEFCEDIILSARKNNIPITVNHIGSLFSIFFTDSAVCDYQTAARQNKETFKRYFHSLLLHGIYFSPSGYETNFLSTAHTPVDIQYTRDVIDETFATL